MENEAHNTLSKMTVAASSMLRKLKEVSMCDTDETATDDSQKKDTSIHGIETDVSTRKASLDELALDERIRKLQVLITYLY